MNKRTATTIYVTKRLREAVKPLQDLSGLSFSDLVSLGLLQLLAGNLELISFGPKRSYAKEQLLREFSNKLGITITVDQSKE